MFTNNSLWTINPQLVIIAWDIEYWYQYVTQGLKGEIQGHTRKDQRTCQRHFCNNYSKLQRLKEQLAEHFI